MLEGSTGAWETRLPCVDPGCLGRDTAGMYLPSSARQATEIPAVPTHLQGLCEAKPCPSSPEARLSHSHVCTCLDFGGLRRRSANMGGLGYWGSKVTLPFV